MSQQIFLGHWTDWSYGPVIRERITLNASDGRYLIAFVAAFDVWAGSATWKLLAFLVHQCRATRKERELSYHQLQVALRNSSTATTFLENASGVIWASRKQPNQHVFSKILLIVAPIVLSISFAVVGVMSARIASEDAAVLLKGGNCGSLLQEYDSPLDTLQVYLNEDSQDGVRMTLSNAYAQECYLNPKDPEHVVQTNSDVSRLDCNSGYAKGSLNYTTSVDLDCPFGSACIPGADVLHLDTGFLDSHKDFGINQPQENRVLFRKLTSCTPLTTSGFSDDEFHPVPGYDFLGDIAVYSYGENYYQPTRSGVTPGLPSPNATFVYGANSFNASETAYYMMVASTLQNGSSSADYTPLTEIMADPTKPLSLVFLANRAFYQGMVNDTWFQATTPIDDEVNGNLSTTLYQSLRPGSVLACTEQAQFCNPNTRSSSNCTDLDTWYMLGGYSAFRPGGGPSALREIGLNDFQQLTALMMQDAAVDGAVWNVVDQLGDKALVASNYLSKQEIFWSPGLSNTQWQIEAANWFSIGLSHMQRLFVANYRAPTEPILRQYWRPFPRNATQSQTFCSSQKVQSQGYMTFSVLGIGLNFSIGGLLLVCGHVLPYLIPWLQGRLAKGGRVSIAREQWKAHGALQLLRVILEKEGGDWSSSNDSFPVTTDNKKFKPLLLRTVSLGSGDSV